jgi:hypothetical protein
MNGSNPQDEIQGEIESLGAELSIRVGCSIRYCASIYAKPVFECNHRVSFPLFALQGARSTGDWSDIIKRHKEFAV